MSLASIDEGDDWVESHFDVTRGSFTIPAALLEDGREDDLRRHYAQSMPEGAQSAGRDRQPDGSVVVRWRRVVVVRVR